MANLFGDKNMCIKLYDIMIYGIIAYITASILHKMNANCDERPPLPSIFNISIIIRHKVNFFRIIKYNIFMLF